MARAMQHKEFAANLKKELHVVEAFNVILQEEQCTLLKGEIEDLDFLTSEKERLITQLTILGEQREQFLTLHGLLSDTEGMKKLFSIDESYAETNKIWDDLLELVTVTNQLNRTNGTIINTRLQHTQRSLNALQCATGSISLYGSKGQAFGISEFTGNK